ncbi:hypothetical protein [Nonomuraea sp. NPDC048916]|uniref:hypothetical protein n=1 Tax=Nonomuraea sp. NPDC048916 TaxID=3154232 RepID=UPI0033F2480A
MDATDNTGRRALVVGLGISGIATALRLRQIGWTPVVIERAAARRSGGYFIALFGAGRSAAGRHADHTSCRRALITLPQQLEVPLLDRCRHLVVSPSRHPNISFWSVRNHR